MINRYIRRVLHPAVRYTVQRISFVLAFAAILFLAAGKLSWFRGWVYLLYGLVLEVGAILVLAEKAPKTLDYRGTWQGCSISASCSVRNGYG